MATDTIHRFAMAIDDRDWAAFAAVLSDPVDVHLDPSLHSPIEGDHPRQRWVDQARSFFETLDRTHHHLTLYRIDHDASSDELVVTSYFRAGHFKSHFVGGATFDQVGRYAHRMVPGGMGLIIRGWTQTIDYTEGNSKILATAGGSE